jgi:5-methylcytosine-specific restriction endonuclease McrA
VSKHARYDASPKGKARRQRYYRSEAKLLRDARRRAIMAGAFIADVPAPEPPCYWCWRSDVPMQIDHVRSLAAGGQHFPGNVVSACAGCNASKADRQVFSGHGEPGQLGLLWLIERFEGAHGAAG